MLPDSACIEIRAERMPLMGTIKDMVRSIAGIGLLRVSHYTGASWLYRVLVGRRRGIISFHNVLPEAMLTNEAVYDMDASVEQFERQIRYLCRKWRLLPIEKLHDASARGFFISFDDGMLNARSVIVPILERFGLRAMFAVCPGLIDGEIPHAWKDHFYLLLKKAAGSRLLLPMDGYQRRLEITDDGIDGLVREFSGWVISKRIAGVYEVLREFCARNGLAYRREAHKPERFHPLTWEMVRDMQAEGHLIASHTWSHRMLALLSSEEKHNELARSRRVLEERLGARVDSIVYPYGTAEAVDEQSVQIARDAGYRHGYMNIPSCKAVVEGLSEPRLSLRSAWHTPPRTHAELSGLKDALQRLG